MRVVFYVIIALCVVGWVLGEYTFKLRGNAINVLLLIAFFLLAWNLVSGGPGRYRRSR